MDTPEVNTDRKTSVPPPPWHPLTTEQLYGDDIENSRPNIQELQKHLTAGGLLSAEHASKIIKDVSDIMREEATCLDLWGPVTIVGDIHGQFYDLAAMIGKEFQMTEDGPVWLFLGDYVDRGFWGCEVCLLLYALKINFPRRVYLLRGNHESRVITQKFNFKEECCGRYGEDVYDIIMESFDCMPLAATIGTDKGTYFAVHGGLSPDIDSIDDINSIDRFCEIPRSGPMCDLTWSDPLEEDTALRVQEKDMWEWWNVDFCDNPTRGIGQVFGYSAITQFLADNCILNHVNHANTAGLIGIIRAHEVAREGYTENWMCKKEAEPSRTFPFVVTVFSAPNYCGWYGNKAAIMILHDSGEYEYKQFFATEETPFVLPKQLNAFSYSMPILIEKMCSLFSNFLNLVLDETKEAEIDSIAASQTRLRAEIMRQSLKNTTKEFQESNERTKLLIKLKGLYGGTLPKEADQLSNSNIQQICDEFFIAKEADTQSEMHPSLDLTAKPQSPRNESVTDDDLFWKAASKRTGLTPRETGTPVKKR